eukprot:644693-Pyramimonas_sp.AAC.1
MAIQKARASPFAPQCDETYDMDSDEHDQHQEPPLTTGMARLVLADQRRRLLLDGQMAATRVQ